MLQRNFDIIKLKNIINLSYFIAGLFLSFLVFLFNDSFTTKLSFFTFFILTSLLIFNKRYNRNIFSIHYTFYSLVFLLLPLGFILLEHSYMFGKGILSLPYSQEYYRSTLGSCILKLIYFWFFLWLSIYVITSRKENIKTNPLFEKINFNIVIFVAIVGVLISLKVNQIFTENISKEINPGINYFRWIFSDPVIIVYSTLVYIYIKNQKNYFSNLLDYKFFFILILYLANFTFLTSKGGILIIFVMVYLVSITGFNRCDNLKIMFPKYTYMIFIFLAMILIFTSVGLYRSSQLSMTSFGLGEFFNLVRENYYEFLIADFYKSVSLVVERLANHGLDQFIIINSSFNEYDLGYALIFLQYISKNFINLLLPGTIFLDSYVPSSQLFSDIILKKTLYGESNELWLLQNLNTQPFSFYGFSLILLGNFVGPFFVFIFFFVIQKISLIFNNIFFKATFGLVFWHSLIVYSFESIAVDFQFFVQLLIIHFIIKTLSLIRIYKK